MEKLSDPHRCCSRTHTKLITALGSCPSAVWAMHKPVGARGSQGGSFRKPVGKSALEEAQGERGGNLCTGGGYL